MIHIKIKSDDLIHAISNIAYVTADIHEGASTPHALHQVYDVCQEGNIERVADILTLAFSNVEAILTPVIEKEKKCINRKSGTIHKTFTLTFGEKACIRAPKLYHSPPALRRLSDLIKEYMTAMVLADWFSITLPRVAETWKVKTERCLDILQGILVSSYGGAVAFRRPVSPF